MIIKGNELRLIVISGSVYDVVDQMWALPHMILGSWCAKWSDVEGGKIARCHECELVSFVRASMRSCACACSGVEEKNVAPVIGKSNAFRSCMFASEAVRERDRTFLRPLGRLYLRYLPALVLRVFCNAFDKCFEPQSFAPVLRNR